MAGGRGISLTNQNNKTRNILSSQLRSFYKGKSTVKLNAKSDLGFNNSRLKPHCHYK
jgi:hypothetical protein